MTYYEPVFSHEDLRQEQALRALEGKPISLGLLRKKMGRTSTSTTSFSQLPEFWEPQAYDEPTSDEQLISWALDQSTEVQKLVDDFLKDPDGLLDHVLQTLGVQIPKAKGKGKSKGSYTQMVLNSLPATYEDLLIMLAREKIARPASTLRQITRRLNLTTDPNGLICR
jgi:hypothetical protein